MKPVVDAAKREKKRVIFAEGEDERVLRAAQIVVDECIAYPVLIGRPHVIQARIGSLGLRLKSGTDIEVVHGVAITSIRTSSENTRADEAQGHHPSHGAREMRARTTLIAAMHVRRGYADAMLCGVRGTYDEHLRYVRDAIGPHTGNSTLAAMNMLMLPDRQLFICDTYVNRQPSVAQVVEMTLLAAAEVRRFGLIPSVALLSHSSFGSSEDWDAQTMREAYARITELEPELEIDGEMRGDAALSRAVLKR